jgi:hypothetical protein
MPAPQGDRIGLIARFAQRRQEDAINTAMIPITTRSSTNVNAFRNAFMALWPRGVAAVEHDLIFWAADFFSCFRRASRKPDRFPPTF